MQWRVATLCFLAGILASNASHGAEPRVVAVSGTAVAGIGIAAFDDPQAGRRGEIFFRAPSTRITVGGLSFATGDPLPAPFQGTIESITQAEVASALGAFLFTANGPDLTAAIFAVENGAIVPLLTIPTGESRSVRRFAMNARGDLVYFARVPGDTEVRALPRSGTDVLVAGDQSGRIEGLVIDETGAAAWDVRGRINHWDATHGVRFLASESRAIRRSGRSPVAIHETYGVAFVTRAQAVLWRPENEERTILVRRREELGNVQVRTLYGDIGFEPNGGVVVRMRAKPSDATFACARDGVTAPCDGPSGMTSAGTSFRPDASSALVRSNGSGLVPVVTPGEALASSTIADVTAHRVDGGTVTFLALLDDGRSALARWRDGVTELIAADGPIRRARTLALESLYDTTAGTVVIGGSVTKQARGSADALALAVVRPNGRIAPVLGPRKARIDVGGIVDAVLARNRLIALGSQGLFSARRRRLSPLLLEGVGTIGRHVASIDLLASDGDRTIFVLTDDAGAIGVFEIETTGIRRLAPLSTLPSLLDVVGPDVVVFGSDGILQLVRDGVTSPILTVGAPTPVGALDAVEWMTIAGDDVVLSAAVQGSGAHHALLAVDLP